MAGAELERRVGLGRGAARPYLREAGVIRGAMLARLWDPAAGAFVVNTDDPSHNHTQDAQVESILGGITSRTQTRQALAFIDSHLMTPFGVAIGQLDDDPYMGRYISPFISSIELLARLSVGDTNGALNLMRRTWWQMLARGPGTVWESMRLDGVPKSGGISLAHGWAGGPVPALSGYVLGIRPTAPGYRHWIVAPRARQPALRPGPGAHPARADLVALAPRRRLVRAHGCGAARHLRCRGGAAAPARAHGRPRWQGRPREAQGRRRALLEGERPPHLRRRLSGRR